MSQENVEIVRPSRRNPERGSKSSGGWPPRSSPGRDGRIVHAELGFPGKAEALEAAGLSE